MNNFKLISSLQNNFIIKLYKSSCNNGKTIILNFFKNINEYDEMIFNYLLCTQKSYDNNKHKINSNFKEAIIVTKEIIDKLSFVKTKSEILGVTNFIYPKIDNQASNILVLENINDHNNLASIIRSCVAFNIKDIYVSANSVNPYNEKVLRGIVGSFVHAHIEIFNDIEKLIYQYQYKNYDIVATYANKNAKLLDAYQFDNKKKYVIIMGNEVRVISPKVISLANELLYINIQNIESLNLSSVIAIILYKVYLEKLCKK